MSGGEVFIVAVVAIICGTVIVVVFMGMLFSLVRGRRKGRNISEDEGAMIQDLWNGIQKMEQRINNLETILLHRQKVQDFEKKL
jgi:phage shock protein B